MMMYRPVVASVIACLIGLCSVPAWGVVVLEKGKNVPTVGYLVRQDDNLVVIRELLPNGQTRQRDLLRSQLDYIRIAVSEERLERLSPDKPEDYRDYAEELAEKRKDPDARAASLRLYLIAAHLDPENLGRSCLLGMVALACHPDEERKFRAMAYLMDPNHDRSLLKSSTTVVQAGSVDDSGQEVLLKALQAFRRGQRRTAMTLAKRPIVRETLERFSDVLTYEEFTQLAKEIPADVLRKVLVLEMMLSNREARASERPKPEGESWSRIVEREGRTPVPSLTLEALTEFDPRKCLYRDGRWVPPDEKP
jgi:hypothetical protein